MDAGSCRAASAATLWRLTMTAAVLAGLLSYALLFGTSPSQQLQTIDPARLSTDMLEVKEALYHLVDDSQWRLRPASAVSDADLGSRRKRHLASNNNRNNNHNNNNDYNNDDDAEFNCEQIAEMIPSMSFLAAGWTKAVYTARTADNRTVAVKTVDPTGQDIGRCLEKQSRQRRDDQAMQFCYQKAARKLIKEIVVLRRLVNHGNIVRLLGYCVPKHVDWREPKRGVTIVTELGEPINLIRLLQMSWEDRLRIVVALSRLGHYLSQHPAGSLVLNDMRRQQFVIATDGELKLVDVDDVGMEEPTCLTDLDCRKHVERMTDVDVNLTCDARKVCAGANELRNTYNIARHFATFLLPYGAPQSLKAQVDQLVDGFHRQSLNANQLRRLSESLVFDYSTGAYLGQNANETFLSNFVPLAQSDLPDRFDYPCQGSLTQITCSLSVTSLAEAAQLCSVQPSCRAFVWTSDKTWTGRTIVQFKNDVRTPSKRSNRTLYVKVD